MSQNSADADWSEQSINPDPDRDLGYDFDNWERIRTRDREDEKYLYLPEDEEMLRKEAFVVVAPDDVVDLVAHC